MYQLRERRHEKNIENPLIEINPLKFQARSELETLMPLTLRSVKRKASETVNLFLNGKYMLLLLVYTVMVPEGFQ